MKRFLVAIACMATLVGCSSVPVTASASPLVPDGGAGAGPSAAAHATLSPSLSSAAPDASPSTTPSPSPSLLPRAHQRDLLGTKTIRQTEEQMSAAVSGAFQSNPTTTFTPPWAGEISLVRVTAALKVCGTASQNENKLQASARSGECASLVAALYTAYRLSGEDAFYDAALVALNYGRTSLPYGYGQQLVEIALQLIGTADHELDCAANPPVVPAMPSLEPGQKTYVIEPGDSGSRIAHDFGLTRTDLIAANPHVRFAFGDGPGCAPVIAIGNTIVIPKPGG